MCPKASAHQGKTESPESTSSAYEQPSVKILPQKATLCRNFRVDFAQEHLFMGMEFVFSVFSAARSIRSVIRLSLPTSLFTLDPHQALLKRHKYLRRKQSQLRLKVLRRDRYRCRGCDKKGDEVTLGIHQLHRDGSKSDDFLTFCAPCQDLVRKLDLGTYPLHDVLRLLWGHLYTRHDQQCRR